MSGRLQQESKSREGQESANEEQEKGLTHAPPSSRAAFQSAQPNLQCRWLQKQQLPCLQREPQLKKVDRAPNHSWARSATTRRLS